MIDDQRARLCACAPAGRAASRHNDHKSGAAHGHESVAYLLLTSRMAPPARWARGTAHRVCDRPPWPPREHYQGLTCLSAGRTLLPCRADTTCKRPELGWNTPSRCCRQCRPPGALPPRATRDRLRGGCRGETRDAALRGGPRPPPLLDDPVATSRNLAGSCSPSFRAPLLDMTTARQLALHRSAPSPLQWRRWLRLSLGVRARHTRCAPASA